MPIYPSLYNNHYNANVPVVRCPSVPTWNNLDVDKEDDWVGALINVTCAPGYKFSVGEDNFIIQCLPNGTWNFEIPECLGKFITMLKLFFDKSYFIYFKLVPALMISAAICVTSCCN